MGVCLRKRGVAKYYIVIGRHPKPKSRKQRDDLHVVGKLIALNCEDSDQELSERIKHEYTSILGSSLCEKRSEARSLASYLEGQGYIDVEVCAVVPLKKFVREPRLVVEDSEGS